MDIEFTCMYMCICIYVDRLSSKNEVACMYMYICIHVNTSMDDSPEMISRTSERKDVQEMGFDLE